MRQRKKSLPAPHLMAAILMVCLCNLGIGQNVQKTAYELYDEILKTRNPSLVKSMLDGFDIASVSDDSLRSYLYYYKGTAYGQLGQMDSALFYVDAASKSINYEQHPVVAIQIERAYGNIYWAKSYFRISLDKYQKSLSIAEKIKNDEFQVSLLGNIAGVHAKLENYGLALEYARKADRISKKSGVFLARSHMKIGVYLVELGKYREAIDSFEKTLSKMCVVGNDSIALAVIQEDIGKAYLELGELEEAKKRLLLAEEIFDAVNYPNAPHQVLIARLALLNNDISRAQTYLSSAQSIAEKRGDLTQLLSVKTFDKELKLRLKQYEKVVETQEEIIALRDSIKSTEMINRVYELEVQFEAAKKQSEIESLALENKLNTANLARARNAQYALAIGGILSVSLLIVFFTLRSKKQKAEKEAQELQLEAVKKRFMELHTSPAELAVNLDLEELNGKLNNPLTEREFDTLQLTIKGKTNTEIAEQLFISINTVKYHLKNTYSKIGVGNRKEAFQYMLAVK